jgi:hypothetical protein
VFVDAAMSLSSREWDELKLLLDKSVLKFMGFNEPTLVVAALNCIDKGYDKRKTVGKTRATTSGKLWVRQGLRQAENCG